MPKKSKNKFTVGIDQQGALELNAEEFTPQLETWVQVFPLSSSSGAAPGAGVELSLLTADFTIAELAADTITIDFYLGMQQTTDAGPGTTTFIVRIYEPDASATTTLASRTGTELAGVTDVSVMYSGYVIIDANGGCTGAVQRVNTVSLFANPAADVGDNNLYTIADKNNRLQLELAVVSSDAGTRFEDPSGFIRITYVRWNS